MSDGDLNKPRVRKVVVVDQDDSEIGCKAYNDLGYEDIYRVTALWLTDLERTHILITQRALAKHNDPGKWMPSASGTIEEGETYDSNVITEAEEELGLTDINPLKAAKYFVDDGKHRFFVQLYTAKVNKNTVEITVEEEYVEGYEWVSIESLETDVTNHPEKYVPSMLTGLKASSLLND
jgi:isopentenyldiphosphate isomerase